MPIYEYLCAGCQHKFDRLQKMSDAPLLTCPDCGEDKLTKLVSAPSFRLSGSGWYETDFKSDKDKKKNLAGDASSDKKASPKKIDNNKKGNSSGSTSQPAKKDSGSAAQSA